jgi:hypothetical protein
VVVGLSIGESAWGGPHPFFDDSGNVNWRPTYAQALAQAQKAGRPIFVDASKDGEKNCEDQVTKTYREEGLGQLLNRYFIPVAVDFQKPPAELKGYIEKSGKKGAPVILVMSERGQISSTFSGVWQAKSLKDALMELLQDKFALPKSKETELTKQIDLLKKALEQPKTWANATKTFRTIQQSPGYTPLKDQAYDLIDRAQAGGRKEADEAYNHVRQNEFAEAKTLLEKVAKTYTGLPLGDEAKDQLAAVKIMEAAETLAKDPKRKADAVRQFDTVLAKHFDTPYAALALARKKELIPPKK